jgi:hypothetical protein
MTTLKRLLMTGLGVAALTGVASAQQMRVQEGGVWSFHSKAQGACPALDWHVVLGPNNALSGMIAWNNMQSMARVSGTLNTSNNTFHLNAKEVGGQGRTATVEGSVRGDGWLNASINGPGVKCTSLTIPWYSPTQAGGGGG